MPTTASTAPMMPVAAANTAHINSVATARPPGSRPTHSCVTVKRRSAMPERSRIAPMKTKSGTAAKEWLIRTSCVRPGNCMPMLAPKKSSPKTKASAISENAIGKPAKTSRNSAGNTQKAGADSHSMAQPPAPDTGSRRRKPRRWRRTAATLSHQSAISPSAMTP